LTPTGVTAAGNEVPAQNAARNLCGHELANVHCEIEVDDNVATQVDQFVRPNAGSTDPMNGVLPCGASLPNP
jgi:hypothetical protein